MEFIYALGRYWDGQDVFSKSYITIALAILTGLLHIHLGYYVIIPIISVVLLYTIGIGKYNAAFDKTSFDLEDKTLYIFDYPFNKLSSRSTWLAGILGMSARFFLPAIPLFYFTELAILMLLAGPVYAICGELGRRGVTKMWESAELITGFLIGIMVVSI